MSDTVTQQRAVTVYGSSSSAISPQILETTHELGRRLAQAGYRVVSGGGRTGVMAAVTEGAISAGGHATGVLPQFMFDRGWGHPALSETIVTDGMHPRKHTMAKMSCAAIAMPGGVGTFDELLEIITWRQLGLYKGHVMIFNIGGYFDPLLSQFDAAIKGHFMSPDSTTLWKVVTTVDEVMATLATEPDERVYIRNKLS